MQARCHIGYKDREWLHDNFPVLLLVGIEPVTVVILRQLPEKFQEVLVKHCCRDSIGRGELVQVRWVLIILRVTFRNLVPLHF